MIIFTNNYAFRENSFRYKFEGDEIVSKDIYLKDRWPNIFGNHLDEVQEFMRLGANVHLEGNTAIIQGVTGLNGAQVIATVVPEPSSKV